MPIPTRKQKLIRKEFPKVRQIKRRGNTYYAVDLRRKFWKGQKWKNFSNRDAALKYAVGLAASIQSQGVPSIVKRIANLEDEKLSRWNEQLGAHGKTIEDAVEFMLTHLEKEQQRRESEHVSSAPRSTRAKSRSEGGKSGGKAVNRRTQRGEPTTYLR